MNIVRIAMDDDLLSPSYYAIEEDDIYVIIENPFESNEIVRTGKTMKQAGKRLLVPCEPTKLVCVRDNFEKQVDERIIETPQVPFVYILPSSTAVGNDAPIVFPRQSQRVESETELALVIKSRAKNVTIEEASAYIMGYTIVNNFISRDIWLREKNILHARGFDNFTSIGPRISTDFKLDKKALKTIVDGRLIQDSNIGGMLFTPEQVISYTSKIMTLMPGDVILLGTPAQSNEVYRGEIADAYIDGIGNLSNLII